MFSDNEPSYLSAHLSFSVINVKEDSFLMVHITHVPGKFRPRNNLHLLSSVCLCGLFHSGVIYCSTISLALISHSSDWDVIFFLHMSGLWKLKMFFLSVAPSQLYLALLFKLLIGYSLLCFFISFFLHKNMLFLLYKDIQISSDLCFIYMKKKKREINSLDVKVC